MKLSKKILAAFSVAAMLACAGTFVACSDDEGDDDPEGAITKVNSKNYNLDYYNKDGYENDATDSTKNPSGTYRAWRRTALKHLGTFAKVTLEPVIDGTASSGAGVMGLVFDLKKSDGTLNESESDTSDAEQFYIVGLRNNGSKLQYYVSEYWGVTEKQAQNFGVGTNTGETFADLDKTKTGEWVIKDFTEMVSVDSATEKKEIWIDIYPKVSDADQETAKYGKHAPSTYSTADIGAFFIDIYTSDPTVEGFTATDNENVFRTKIDAGAGKTAYTAKPSQGKLAVYANIYKGGHMKGAWKYDDTYAEDEVVEE